MCYLYKKRIGEVYREEEIISGGFKSGTRNYKGKEIIITELSPGRLKDTLKAAEKRYPALYKTVNVPKLVNEKCRKKRGYMQSKNTKQ